MVDVTVDNFEDALRRLQTLVPQCDFVAIDLEFTGLDHDAFGAAQGGGGREKFIDNQIDD
jgi:hypothetical protein